MSNNLTSFSIEIEDGESSQNPHVILVPLAVPANDFPYSVTVDLNQQKTVLYTFSYSPSNEPRIEKTLTNSTVEYGEKTGRVYDVKFMHGQLPSPESYQELSEFLDEGEADSDYIRTNRILKNLGMGSVILDKLRQKLQAQSQIT